MINVRATPSQVPVACSAERSSPGAKKARDTSHKTRRVMEDLIRSVAAQDDRNRHPGTALIHGDTPRMQLADLRLESSKISQSGVS